MDVMEWNDFVGRERMRRRRGEGKTNGCFRNMTYTLALFG